METTTKHNNCAALNETNKIITNELIMTIQNQRQKTNPEIGNKTQQNGESSPPSEGGDDCNPRQPDYNRGRLTRAVEQPSFREIASCLAMTGEKIKV